MEKLRGCLFPGCSAQVARPHLLCVSHYRQLPPRIQAGVQERIRGWKDTGAAVDFLLTWLRVQKVSAQ